jgi:AcrR family transcriptional regulator
MANETAKRRNYRKRRRAEQEAETRQRITEATVRLHGTVGPAETTVSGIAREAGVQRATVYRHFPDEEALFAACSAHYIGQHPLPDPGRWEEIADPAQRLRHGLRELYGWFGETEQMTELTSRDADRVPAMRNAFGAMVAYFELARSALLRGRPQRGRARTRVSAAIGHAIAFPTWRSLVREQGLDEDDAVELMVSLVEATARFRP